METTPSQQRVTGLMPIHSEGAYHVAVPGLIYAQFPMIVIETCWRHLKRKVAYSAAARYIMEREQSTDLVTFKIEFDASMWTGRR